MRRDREKKLLVVGATAIDLIGFYPAQFKQYEKEYRPKSLNVSLQLAGLAVVGLAVGSPGKTVGLGDVGISL